MILVFGGTTEGKITAELLDFIGESFFYSTKTNVLTPGLGTSISGALDLGEIVDFCKDNSIRLIIDAAHPFASQLHQNIHTASSQLTIPVLRYERVYDNIQESGNIRYFDSFEQLSQALLRSNFQQILALTGVQTISMLKSVWSERACYFRILNTPLSRLKAQKTGILNEYIIPMNPSANVEELRQLAVNSKAEIILSKESGLTGFMKTKIEVATQLSIELWIVRRPVLPDYDFTANSEKKLLQQIYALRKTALKKDGLLRSGFTTGTCVTAAAKASFLALAEGKFQKSVEIFLPNGDQTKFLIFPESLSINKASCVVIKDGGDDPDATHAKEIGCELNLKKEKGITFTQGKGIGKVTLPGLPVAVGEPAINPGPRKMITDTLKFLFNKYDVKSGIEVKPFVPEGNIIAQQTFNSRVGVVEGISILGTSGYVKPFSHEAFISTIKYQLSVAYESGCDEIVLTSGKRSENMLRTEFPHLPDTAFVHFGNLIGLSIQMAASQGIKNIHLGIMFGKAIKLAEGHIDTHSKNGVFNANFAAEIATKCNYSQEICNQIKNMKLANSIRDLIPFSETEPFYVEVAQRCYNRTSSLVRVVQNFCLFQLTERGEKIKIANK